MTQSWLSIVLHYYALTKHFPTYSTSAYTTNENHLGNINETQRLLPKSNRLPTNQRIVILAGPHKTASSSLQNNMFTWTSIDPQILPRWAWPVPNEVLKFYEKYYDIPEKNPYASQAKGFYPLVEALLDGKSKNRSLFKKYSKDTVMNFYRNEIRKEWRNGFNIIVGTEALDFLTSDRMNSNVILDKFLKVLPMKDYGDDDGVDLWGVDKTDVIVVVKFRAPRVDHLISVWHQCCMKTMTLMEFLTTLPDSNKNMNRLHKLDSFRLSEIFLKRGINVALMDMSGIAHGGYDISNVVACDILKTNCTKTNDIVTVKNEEGNVIPSMKNVQRSKGDIGGVTDWHLDRIENILRKYDCNYKHVLEYKNLTVLYNYKLSQIMATCSQKNTVGSISNRRELAERIKNIVIDRDSNE